MEERTNTGGRCGRILDTIPAGAGSYAGDSRGAPSACNGDTQGYGLYERLSGIVSNFLPRGVRFHVPPIGSPQKLSSTETVLELPRFPKWSPNSAPFQPAARIPPYPGALFSSRHKGIRFALWRIGALLTPGLAGSGSGSGPCPQFAERVEGPVLLSEYGGWR